MPSLKDFPLKEVEAHLLDDMLTRTTWMLATPTERKHLSSPAQKSEKPSLLRIVRFDTPFFLDRNDTLAGVGRASPELPLCFASVPRA